MVEPKIKSPPAAPLPDPTDNPDWYGQIWVRYPSDPQLYTTHFPHLFHATSRMRTIMLRAWQVGRHINELGGSSRPVLQVCNDYFACFKAWYDDLPASLAAASLAHPGPLMLQ